MKALVLGATGHIGSHVVRALLAEGHQVRAAYRGDRFLFLLDGLPVERARVDLDTLEGLRDALDGCDWVFHTAGYYPWGRRPRRDNPVEQGMRSTRRILEQIRRAKPRRVVFTSSAATIRHVPGRLANEQDAEAWPLQGSRALYATVKIAMEHEALQAGQGGVPVVVVNPSLCIGEYDAHPFSGRAVLAYAKHRLPVYVEHPFNAVYTGDVGIGHIRAAERGALGERYLLTGRTITLKEFAGLVASCAGTTPPRWRLPYPLVLAAAHVAEAVAWVTRTEPWLPRQAVHAMRAGQWLDGAKARRELGLPQTSVEEAIERAVRWFRQHRYC